MRGHNNRLLIQITKAKTVFLGSDRNLKRLRAEFHRRHCIILKRFFHPKLLGLIQREISQAKFFKKIHKGISIENCMRDNLTYALLQFLLNDEELFRRIEGITGCKKIGYFNARVYRMTPGKGHYDSWHSDASDYRMIGMSVNLSTGIYGGGVLQLAHLKGHRPICEVANTGLGDAIVFRLAPSLTHRLTPVTGKIPKTAVAGWFQSRPLFRTMLAKGFGKREANSGLKELLLVNNARSQDSSGTRGTGPAWNARALQQNQTAV